MNCQYQLAQKAKLTDLYEVHSAVTDGRFIKAIQATSVPPSQDALVLDE